jgi:hypothetical protein
VRSVENFYREKVGNEMVVNEIDRPKHVFLHGLVAVAASLFVFSLFLLHPGMHTNPRAFLSSMVYQSAEKPLVYRTLLPTTVQILSQVVPESKRSELALSVLNHRRLAHLLLRLHLEPAYPVETLIALVLIYASLWGFMIALLRLFDSYYSAPPEFRLLIPTLGILGLPPFFAYTNYPYDFCTLFFSTLCLLLVAQGRWRMFLLVFALACLNKETAVLLIPVFGIYAFKRQVLPRRDIIWVLGWQSLIYLVIRSAIVYRFHSNLGSVLEFHLYDHNLIIFDRWLTHGFSFGQLAIAGLAAFLLCYGWSSKPLLLKLGLIALPPLLIMCLFFGYFDEWRAYFDAYPAAMLLLIDPVGKLFGAKLREAS